MSDENTVSTAQEAEREELLDAVVRFAGDSGDGMQLTGTQFASETAWAGTDLATLPNYPAEIRAPAGTLFGVSSFQVHFGSKDVRTPGDSPDLLVAMNPAALKVHLPDVKDHGVVIVNADAFDARNLRKAGYQENPLEDEVFLESYTVYALPISRVTREAVAASGLTARDAARCKNFFALGLVSWLFDRPTGPAEEWAKAKFKKLPKVLEGNLLALKAGNVFAENTDLFLTAYKVEKAPMEPGEYRQVTGNAATAYGLTSAAVKAGRPLVYGAYPITPASDILHELAHHKAFGVRTFQAEDEIAAVNAAIGASFAGAIGVTGTSGPGLALKGEALGLAVMVELPLVIINVQRGGPSTGLPTKTEQADLLQALFGRHGECPMVVMAALTPGDCFYVAYDAIKVAIKHMCPVLVLTDGYLANGAEPWRVPAVDDLPAIDVTFRTEPPTEGQFLCYQRDPETLARPWAIPGTPGLEHRLGGLEKENRTGNVSYDPDNHQEMIRARAEKIERVAREFPPTKVTGPDHGRLLVIGWGGTYGSIAAACDTARSRGFDVAHIQLRHLHPLPLDLGDIIRRYDKVLVPEINAGQLRWLLRARYCVEAEGYNRIRGLPLIQSGLVAAIEGMMNTPVVAGAEA